MPARKTIYNSKMENIIRTQCYTQCMFQRLQSTFNLTDIQVIEIATYDHQDTWLNGRRINTMEQLMDWVCTEFMCPLGIEERFDELKHAKQDENEKQLAAVECLKFMDYIYKDGQWMPHDEEE